MTSTFAVRSSCCLVVSSHAHGEPDSPDCRLFFAIAVLRGGSTSSTGRNDGHCTCLQQLSSWMHVCIYCTHDCEPPGTNCHLLVLGLSGDFQHIWFYHNTWLYTIGFKLRALQINVAWGWFTFSINTTLSAGIIGKIMCVTVMPLILHSPRLILYRYTSRKADRLKIAHPYRGNPYHMALAAVVESALVIWIGLLLYEVAELAPTGYVTVSTRRLSSLSSVLTHPRHPGTLATL